MKQFPQVTILATLLATVLASPGRADVTLSGPDSNDGTYSVSQLAGAATVGDTFTSGGVTGISLWGLLGGTNTAGPVYGDITTFTPAGDNSKNAILRYYLLASDGSANSVISLGEIDPNFGGTAAIPAFVAYQTAGGTPLAAPQLVVPGASGRNLSTLTSLELLAVPALPTGPGGVSSTVNLLGQVGDPGNYTLAELQSDFTPAQQTTNGDNYTGIPLWTFLDPNASDITDQLVVGSGTDGYEVVYSLAELDPSLGGNPQDFLPYADTGGNFPADGIARTITPSDNAHGRWLSNVGNLEVIDTPEPASMTLFATGLLSLATLRRRRASPAPHPAQSART